VNKETTTRSRRRAIACTCVRVRARHMCSRSRVRAHFPDSLRVPLFLLASKRNVPGTSSVSGAVHALLGFPPEPFKSPLGTPAAAAAAARALLGGKIRHPFPLFAPVQRSLAGRARNFLFSLSLSLSFLSSR